MALQMIRRYLNSPWASPGVLMGVVSAAITPVLAAVGISFIAELVYWVKSLGLSEGGGFVAALLLAVLGPGVVFGIAMSLFLPAAAVLVVGSVHRIFLEKLSISFRVGSKKAVLATFLVLSGLSFLLWFSGAPEELTCASEACRKLEWTLLLPTFAFCLAQAVIAAFAACLLGRRKTRVPEPSNP